MLTVLFSSFNGAATLPAMLDSFCRLIPPAGGWKIVAVNNASTDSTAEILKGYASKLPIIICSHSVPGKNRALNTGLEFIDGDLVVLTDDDVVPETDWLARLRAAADTNPDFDIFGGSIVPCWMKAPPAWVLSDVVPRQVIYGLTDPHWHRGEITPYNVTGANMAVRSSLFTSGSRFDERVGPDGTPKYTMGSETSFMLEASKKGHRCYFVDDAVVEHLIRPWQLDRRWILKRAYRLGKGEYRSMNSDNNVQVARLAGYPRYLLKQLAAAYLKTISTSFTRSFEEQFSAAWQMHYLRGQLAAARQRRE